MNFSRPQFRLSTLLWITLAVACLVVKSITVGIAVWPWMVKNGDVLVVTSLLVGAWMAAFIVQHKLCRPYRNDP
jgi:hypothetical protein